MEKVVKLASQIGDLFTESAEYKEYMDLYDKLKEDKELMRNLVKYRTIKIQNYVSFTVKDEDNKEFEREVDKLYEKLISDADMKRMLELEDELLKTLSEIYKVIGDRCVMNIEVQ